jgi:hypothetical protein
MSELVCVACHSWNREEPDKVYDVKVAGHKLICLNPQCKAEMTVKIEMDVLEDKI